MRLTPRTAAVLGFGAMSVLCGIAVHLVAELAALGWRADAALIVSARHIPLGILALVALAALAACGSVAGSVTDRRRQLAAIVRCLPNGGVGAQFLAYALAAQFLIFSLTEAGEGLPIQSGDLGLALIAAVLASTAGAFFVARYKARVLGAVILFFVVISTVRKTLPGAASWKRDDAHVRVWRSHAVVRAASRRPPPHTPTIDPFFTGPRSWEFYGVHTLFQARRRASCDSTRPIACSRFSFSC